MDATDVKPSRLFATIRAMRDFVDGLPAADEVGLMTFSDNVKVLAAPTTNHAAVDHGLDTLNAEGGTALGEAVVAAVRIALGALAAAGVHRTPGQPAPAVIVLESDGAQDRGTVTPFVASQIAKRAGIRIYGIALGTRHGSITRGTGLLREVIRVPPSPGTVGMLSSQTGGQWFTATSAASLDSIVRGLGAGIARRHERNEITSWFELAAAVFLVGGVAATRVFGGALP
jgi:Ca-activated chloride channel family protein